ncbi:hypothetical protein BH23GEM2_BH23GEM2_11410 [soil metagenome]
MAASVAAAGAAAAQDSSHADRTQSPPPIGELVRSVGQPARWLPFASGGASYSRDSNARAGVAVSAGIARSYGNPVGGALAYSGEAYLRRSRAGVYGGARALLLSPTLFVHAGADWDQRLQRTDVVFGATAPLRRGGWPFAGSQLRIHWMPARSHTAELGIVVPVAQPLAGRTRPRHVEVRLPAPSRSAAAPALVTNPNAQRELREARMRMTQLVSMLTFFWLIEDRNVRYSASVREWRDVLADFGAEFFPGTVSRRGESQYQREAIAYHTALERSFGWAAGVGFTAATDERGRMLADTARRIALREIVLPYNRTIGQYRNPGSLHGLIELARGRYSQWLMARNDISVEHAAEVEAVFDAWLEELERLRARISENASDPRVAWLPMGLVLRPEDHRTQAQIDELVELALSRRFESGNTIHTIDAPHFQEELKRSIRETRFSHVLWVHDYRGRDDLGRPDRTGFETTMEYLRALRNAVQAYDAAGHFPTYVILVDQHFWEVNNGRLWMNLLERPLGHRVKLSPEFAAMQSEILLMQDSLRTAVAGSTRLQAEAAARGRGWIAGLVKVHVNVTNPADFAFRSRYLMSPPLGSDNLLRDHRKLFLRDADEADPSSGEVVLAGVGVGDHYASATWEDRALSIRGPGVAETLHYLRLTLERHRLGGAAMPAVFRLRSRDPSAPYNAGLEERASARFMQTHNEVGWGTKEASFVQMLLYDLAPAGTLLFVPDALWTSYQWMAQLVGASLRGCHVYIVASARANAPAAGFPWMSAMQELVTRLTLVEEVLGGAIRAGGGDLRVGLYARTKPLDDYAGSLESVVEAWDTHSFLREAVPLSSEALATLARAAQGIRDSPLPLRIIGDARSRRPLLHRKTQWIMGGDALRQLAAAPEMAAALELAASVPRFGAGAGIGSDDDVRAVAVRALLDLHAALPRDAAEAPLYFTTGSINKNVRSMTLDGEVLGVVAGPWSLEPLLDFLVLVGTVSWVRSLSDVETHLPPYSRPRRLIGRWLHPII